MRIYITERLPLLHFRKELYAVCCLRLPETIPMCSVIFVQYNMVMHYNHCFIPIYQQTYKAIYFDTNLLRADKVWVVQTL